MELNSFTEKYLERISDFTDAKELLLDIAKTHSDALEKMKQKGATLDNYNNETIRLFRFCNDLNFIENGVNGSWKDNISNDYSQKYYRSLQQRVEQIIKANF